MQIALQQSPLDRLHFSRTTIGSLDSVQPICLHCEHLRADGGLNDSETCNRRRANSLHICQKFYVTHGCQPQSFTRIVRPNETLRSYGLRSVRRAQYVLIPLIRSPRLFNKGFRNPSVALVILTDDTVNARIRGLHWHENRAEPEGTARRCEQRIELYLESSVGCRGASRRPRN